jgi:hypothetical protein
MTTPNLGYGKPSEATIDQVNIWMRSTPWYQQQLRAWGQDPGHPTLTKAQSRQILREAQANGVVVDEGDMEVDNHGNFNPKGHKLRNVLVVAGIAGAAIATMGAAGVFGASAAAGSGATAGAAPALGGGATLAANLGTASALPSIGVAAGAPALAGGATVGANLGAASAVPGLASSATVPTVGAVAPGAVAPGAVPGTIAATAPRAASLLPGVSNASVFSAGTQLFGNLYGAWMQGKAADKAVTAETAAARYAADVQDAASRRAEAYQREQAENAFLNSEAARHGNYDMYAARERRLGTSARRSASGRARSRRTSRASIRTTRAAARSARPPGARRRISRACRRSSISSFRARRSRRTCSRRIAASSRRSGSR